MNPSSTLPPTLTSLAAIAFTKTQTFVTKHILSFIVTCIHIMPRSFSTCASLLLLSLSTSVYGWSVPSTHNNNIHAVQQQQQVQGRRAFFQGLATTAATVATAAAVVGSPEAASATVAKTGAASPWTGFYDDPNHPGCLRQVKVVGAPLRANGTPAPFPVVEVRGYDGPAGAEMCTEPPATREAIWTVKGDLKNEKAILDFSSKGGPSDLVAYYEDGAIVFPDGNKWTKVALGTPERLPKDMSTLKSKI